MKTRGHEKGHSVNEKQEWNLREKRSGGYGYKEK
jgi:hypothetical protein